MEVPKSDGLLQNFRLPLSKGAVNLSYTTPKYGTNIIDTRYLSAVTQSRCSPGNGESSILQVMSELSSNYLLVTTKNS